MAEIKIEKVRKVFAKTVAVNDVDLVVDEGEFMVLLGPSGCGKTTLLRCIAGLEHPESGSISIDGKVINDLPPRARDISMVFQNYAVFPHLTVFDNIAFGLRMHRVDKKTVDGRVRRAAELVEMSEYLERRPRQLSGGQQQRVSVARAIVMEPAVLLMDEPLSNLDALLRLNFRSELKKLVHELETTTIYVTHDQVEALSLGDRIAVMQEGEVIQCDSPMAVYDEPGTRFVGGFIGNPPMNFLEVRVEGRDGEIRAEMGEQSFKLGPDTRKLLGRNVLAGIRAENVDASTGSSPDAVEATIEVVEPLGSQLLLTCSVGSQTVKLLTATDFPAEEDKPLWIRPVTTKLRWFDPDTGAELLLGPE